MESKGSSKIGTALIILAGCFWGSMGIFVRKLGTYGFSTIQIVSTRITLAALIFSLVLLVKDRRGFKISPKDIPLFLGLAFAGCVLVSGISGEGMTVTGLLIGLGSGIGYGLYSILGKVALRKYSSYTVTTYTFIFAAVVSWIISRPADMMGKFSSAPNLGFLIFFCFLTALITAVIPFLSYTLGLESVEASKTGIIATIEPMVATLIGIFVFAEKLTVMSGAGILLILAAVVILNLKRRE